MIILQEKKARLDPATAATSLGVQRQRAAEAARERSGGGSDGGDSNGAAPLAERLTDAASPTQQQQQPPSLRLDVGGAIEDVINYAARIKATPRQRIGRTSNMPGIFPCDCAVSNMDFFSKIIVITYYAAT